MKKLILILTIFSFTGQELIAQLEDAGGNGSLQRNSTSGNAAERESTSGFFYLIDCQSPKLQKKII